MLTISGTLLVQSSQVGENTHKTGRLICPLGEFIVQHDDLILLRDGQYEGIFELMRIQPKCHECAGKFYFEMEAVLNNMAFNVNNKPLPYPSHQQSITNANEIKAANEQVDPKIADSNVQNTSPIEQSDDAELFGALWPLADEVRLDMAQRRDQLAAQSARLDQLGYEHDMKTQTWRKTY